MFQGYKKNQSQKANPEIQQKPVDDLMLQMKCMGIDKVINFLELVQLEIAEQRLKLLGALEDAIVIP
jgi:ATP-dependent RNA helicase DHX37/DHR1